MTTLTTATTLDVPGARLHYELRGSGPLIALVGAPMDATAFAPLADLLATDHTVLTTDPRGINRSSVDHPDRDSTPVERAADLAALLRHVDAGPATVLGLVSGGAVTVLALVESAPELVHTAIPHEPPLRRAAPRPRRPVREDRADDRHLPDRRHPLGVEAVHGDRQPPDARRGVRDVLRHAARGSGRGSTSTSSSRTCSGTPCGSGPTSRR